jgi:PAS domain S-box-containing protein
VNYLDVWRTASSGDQDAAAAVEGIEAVCDGTSDRFETAYRCQARGGGDRWCVMTVTPLRRPEGGAVIAHADVTHPKIVELAIVAGGARFNELADGVPVPIWIATPDGRVVYGNHAWVEATGSAGGDALADGRWTDAFHPDDRAAAAAAFTAAASRCEAFTIELRLEASDGTCRWWTCIGTPRCAPDGRLQSYVGICHDVTAQRAAQSAFDALAAKLVATQEKERSRIGRELHDDIGQQVALLSSMVDTLLRDRHWSRERIHVVLTETQRHLQDMATSLHVLSHELHPGKLKLLGLVATLESLCRDLSREEDAEIRFEAEHVPAAVGEETAICLFRVAQEALQNAAKHSGARAITVRVSGGPSHLTLAVTDDGSGFDPLASQSSGLGLLTMRERVELLGGRLRIETAQGRGTTIEATVPLTVAEPTAGVG